MWRIEDLPDHTPCLVYHENFCPALCLKVTKVLQAIVLTVLGMSLSRSRASCDEDHEPCPFFAWIRK